MNTIANLYQLQQHIGLAADLDDTRLIWALEAATVAIQRRAGRRFTPVYAAREVAVSANHPGELLLDDDLLELTALTDGSGQTIDLADLLLLPRATSSYAAIERVDGGAFTGPTVTVTGWWAWHDDRALAWRDTADTVENDPLNTTATTLLVTNADAADADGEPLRFQAGGLLRIGDELMRVVSVLGAADQVTVVRGVAGSAAATHLQGTLIERYQPPADVVRLCLRWAAWLYRESDRATADDVPLGLRSAAVALRRMRV